MAKKFKRKIKVKDLNQGGDIREDDSIESAPDEEKLMSSNNNQIEEILEECGGKKSPLEESMRVGSDDVEIPEDSSLEADEGSEDEDCDGGEDVSLEQNLANELVLAKREASENYDKYLRSVAEVENIRKRHVKERRDLIMYAGESLARDLLDVVDSLALAVAQENKGSLEEFVKGIELVYSQFSGVLERHSVRSESLLNKEFDPNKAEALATVPVEDGALNQVIEEFKKAYFFKDKLIRPAQVVVTKAAEVSPDSDAAEQEPQDEGQEEESSDDT